MCILLCTECYWLLKIMLYNKHNYWTSSSSTAVILEWHLWFALKCSGNKIWRMALGIWSLGCDVILLGRLGNALEEHAASIIRVTVNLFYSPDGGSRFLWNACIFLPNCTMAYRIDHSLHRIVKTGGRFFQNGGSKFLDIIHQQTTVIAKKTSDLTNILKCPWQLQ